MTEWKRTAVRLLGGRGQTGRFESVLRETAYRSFLYDSVQHHDAAAPLLPHHLPEVATCVWKGSLKKSEEEEALFLAELEKIRAYQRPSLVVHITVTELTVRLEAASVHVFVFQIKFICSLLVS